MTRKFKWFLRLLFIVSFIISFSVCSNVHAETRARSHKKKYTVTFVDGVTGKIIKTKRVSYGKSVTPPKPKKHKGYRFKKWKGNTKKIKKDTVVKAKYTRVYTVRFYFQGKLVKKEKVEKGKSAHPPKLQPKDYIRITGWDTNYKKVKRNLNIEATYDIWPDWSNQKELFAFYYGGLNNGNETFTGKKISMVPIESHALGQTAIYTPLGRQVFNEFYNMLKNSTEELSWNWVYRKAKNLSNNDFSDLTNTIELEFYGYVCDTRYFNYWHALNYSREIYNQNLVYKSKIEAIAKSLVTPSMTEREASAKFLEYISKKLSYSTSVPARDSRAWYALSNGVGNCQAYSKLYKTMCNAVGIECDLVSGNTYQDGEVDGHLWNRVKIDGKWYYVDITWADDGAFFDRSYVYQTNLWGTHKICSIYA